MKTPIRIKSFNGGLKISLEKSASIQELKEALAEKLKESRKFFGNATVAIAFEGRELTEPEEDSLCDIISFHTDLEVLCVIKTDEDSQHFFDSALRYVKEETERSDVTFFKGSVINQQFLESPKDIVILGDVNPGCTVVSAKSIFVLGGLYGEAYAGAPLKEEKESNTEIIYASELAPEELRIGDKTYEPVKKHRWGVKPKFLPQIAYVSNDKINIETYTKELLSRVL